MPTSRFTTPLRTTIASLREALGMPESPQVGTLLAELLRRRRNGELGGRD